MTSAVELAYNLAVSQLAKQKEDLRAVRSQASLAAAIAGLIATVFGSMVELGTFEKASSGHYFLGMPLEIWFALSPFAASVAFAIRVGIGWKDCTFELNPHWILEKSDEGEGLEVIFKQLAKDADQYFDENEEVIDDARQNLWWSMIAGWVQIPAWLMLLF